MINYRERDSFKTGIIKLRRVGYVTAKGRSLGFSVFVVGSDGTKGTVGLGKGSATEIGDAIRNAESNVRKKLFHFPISRDGKLLYSKTMKFCGTKIILKRTIGTGVRAGSVAKSMLEMAQVTSASCKVLGSKNKVNVAEGMKRLLASYESIEQIAQRRGKTVAELNKNRYMIITGKESTATQRPEREHREKPQRPWGQQNTNKPFERRRFERTNTGAPVRPFSRPFNSRGTDPNRATDPTRGTDQNKPHQYSQNNNYNRFNAHNVKTPNPKNNNEVKS